MDFIIGKTNSNTKVTVTRHPFEGHPGVTLADVEVTYEKPQIPEKITLQWFVPILDMHSVYTPSAPYEKTIRANWGKNRTSSRLACGAPVHQLRSLDGKNRLTVALSDAETPCRIATGVDEKSAAMDCTVEFFTEPVNTLSGYRATVYLDESDRRYDLALKDVDRYWQEVCGYPCAPIPEAARRPLYSCWYSFHQNIDPHRIVEQCRLARAMGMESVIVDDGWQCDDVRGGYAYCGDWEVAASKVPDMKEFVDRVHETGMKFILWFSVPAVGVLSKAHLRFADKLLNPSAPNWASLDPRFPDVRDYLCGIYEKAVRDWGLDGLKLDFINNFQLTPETPAFDSRWDTLSLEDGVDRLLREVTERVRAVKPDLLIEFRQPYFGPVIRKYGNMIRVSDCPNDPIQNRVAGIDLRYLMGSTAIHSDMLMWHPDDTVEQAGIQVISTLFCVPQISVLLDEIPENHREMLRFWLTFWNTHRDTLLTGDLTADNPESSYSQVRSEKDGEIIAVSYAKPLLTVGSFRNLYHVNATGDTLLPIRFLEHTGMRRLVIRDAEGKILADITLDTKPGIYDFSVPRSGMMELTELEL